MTATHTFEHNGKTLTIPAFTALPMGVIRKARKSKDEMDMVFTILEQVMAEDSPELTAIDAMSNTEFQNFIEGWTQGAPLGEA